MIESGKQGDIIAIQEPWIGDKNRGKKKIPGMSKLGGKQITVGNPNFNIIYRIKKENKAGDARVMWMIQKDKNLKYNIHDNIWDHLDLSVMDLEMGEEKLKIMNLYNQTRRGGERE